MPAPKTDPAIYIGDTVHYLRKDRTTGRARWIVGTIEPDTQRVFIHRVTRPDFRTTRYMEIPAAANRIVLVRHGNTEDDDLRRAGCQPGQADAQSDRTRSPYVLHGKAHPAGDQQ